MIWSKYEHRLIGIKQNYPDKAALHKQYVDDPMEVAVGTMVQLTKTKNDLEKAFENMYRELCKEMTIQSNAIMDEYMAELYEKQGYKNKTINDLCYDRAYEKGHSSGHKEVEMLFGEEIEYARKIIVAELKHE